MKRNRRKEPKNLDPEFIRPEPISKKLWVPGDPPVKKSTGLAQSSSKVKVVVNPESTMKAKLENIKKLEMECSTTQKLLFNERQKLFDLYSEVILADYNLCLKFELDSRQWKFCVYNLFCASRKTFAVMSQTEKDIWNSYFITLHQKYTNYIQALQKLEFKYPVWCRSYSHMGDLARYRFQFLVQSPNLLNEARSYYTIARTLAPKNGLYYNQLGLVSRLEGNITDTIHFHLRALCLERPLETARETLLEVFQLLSTSEAEIKTYCNDSFLRTAELNFLRLIQLLYSKIGMDEWPSLMNLLTTNLALGLDDLSKMETRRQMQFCFCLAVIPMSVFHTTQISKTFSTDGKLMLQQKCFELIMTIVSQVSHLVKLESIKIFLGIVLSWIASNEILLEIANDRAFKRHWGSVVDMFNSIAPEGFRDQSGQLKLEEVYSRTANLTEDLQLFGFVPLMNFIGSREWNTTDEKTMEWEYEADQISLRRTARLILLVINIDQNQPFINFTGANRDNAAEILKFEDFGREEMSVDENEDEMERDIKKAISVDNLVKDISVSPDSIVLKEKLQALAQEASASQPKNLVLGQTILVFDTNIFLRGINGISSIIESRKYPVIVPLPVIAELTGISGNDSSIGQNAVEALDYLKTAISEKKFRIQTAKGSFLDSMTNISETWDSKHTNADDVILEICRMHKNICLITDDANLRLKCRTVGVMSLDSIYKIRP